MLSLKSLINSKSIFIFDFDGVLVDSVEVKTEAFAALYEEYGTIVVDKVIQHHRLNGGMSRYEKFKHYHQNFFREKITKDQINILDKKFSNLVVNKVVNSPEIDGVTGFLNKLHGNKKCFVNSATPTAEIKKIVQLREWGGYFTKIYGSPNSKIKNLNNILYYEKNKSIDDCVFFGDAESDFNAATYLGMDFVLLVTASQTPQLTKKVKYHISNFKLLMEKIN
jgi:beta-phosphoglucomutase-like phosphatase (HAD superfamily)